MCLYPKLIKNRKYIANKKNGGVIPAITDNRVLMVPVGCGKCIECKGQKSREWVIRLEEDIKEHKNGKFVTFTFSEESLIKLQNHKEVKNYSGYDLDNKIATFAIRKFMERWRKKYKKSVRHWLVTELGGNNTERIHLHGILYTDNIEDIAKIWNYGIVTIGKSKFNKEGKRLDNNTLGWVNGKTIGYIVKYINKTDKKHPNYNSKILCSKGIGKNYFNRTDYKQNKYKPKETRETYTTKTGRKIALPIYFRNKIYTENEKELLWIEKLDKQERWICGEKIDISKGLEDYYKMLEYYREKNLRLGFGNDEKNWNLIRYENQQRNLKKLERIKTEERKNKIKIEPEDIKNELEYIPMGKIEDAF